MEFEFEDDVEVAVVVPLPSSTVTLTERSAVLGFTLVLLKVMPLIASWKLASVVFAVPIRMMLVLVDAGSTVMPPGNELPTANVRNTRMITSWDYSLVIERWRVV